MPVELSILARDSLLFHVALQAGAQTLSRFALSADAHGEVAFARKNPDIAFEIGQELYIDMGLFGGDPVAERVHGVLGGVLCTDVAQRVASACGDYAIIGFDLAGASPNAPGFAAALQTENTLLGNLGSGGFGA